MGIDYGALRGRYKSYEENGGIIDDDNNGANRRQALTFADYDGVKFWKPEVGDHGVDIIPYITGSQHPTMKAGSVDYVLDVWVHKNVGPNQDNVVCPAKMHKGRCPICEAQQELFNQYFEEELAKQGDSKDKKAAGRAAGKKCNHLQPKRRVYYNLIDADSPEEGIQIFEAPWFWFEKELANNFTTKQRRAEKKNIHIPYFWQHDEGLTVTVSSTQEEYEGREFIKSVPTGFEERLDQYTDDIVEKAYPLDELMVILDFDTIQDIYNGVPVDDATDDSDVAESAPQAEPTQPTVVKVPVDEKKARMERVKAKKASSTECPAGGVFGEDYCGFDTCEECPHVEACEEANQG